MLNYYLLIFYKNNEYFVRLIETMTKFQSDLEKVQARYQVAYNAHQKLDITDRRWQRSFNELTEKKISYLLGLESFNAIQAQFFDLSLPEFMKRIEEQDRLRVETWTKLQRTEKNLAQDLFLRLNENLTEVEHSLNMIVPLEDSQALMASLSKEYALSFSARYFKNMTSINDSPNFTIDPQAVSCLAKYYSALYEKLKKLQEILTTTTGKARGLGVLKDSYLDAPGQGDYGAVFQEWMSNKEQESFLLIEEASLTAQLSRLSSFLKADFESRLHEHSFRPKGMAFNTICDQCGGSIWGMRGSAIVCEDCAFICHSKCQEYVLPFCGLILTPSVTSQRLNLKGPPPPPRPVEKPVVFTPVKLVDRLADTSLSEKLALRPSPVPSLGISHATKKSLPTAAAMYAFTATCDDELSILPEEQVFVTGRENDDGWIKIRNMDGKSGLVPANYLSIHPSHRESISSTPLRSKSSSNVSTDVSSLGLGRLETKDNVSRHSSNFSKSPSVLSKEEIILEADTRDAIDSIPITVPKAVDASDHLADEAEGHDFASDVDPSSLSPLFSALVLYDYDKQEEDELNLVEGQIVTVLERASDGWYLGRNEKGECGHFPANYVAEQSSTLD